MSTTQQRHWPKTIASGLLTLVLVAAIVLAAAVVVVPRVLGGMSLTVLSGSMEPGIKPGDIVVTRGVDKAAASDLAVGDVITFLPFPDDPTLVTHRIIGKAVGVDGVVFTTKGDNNNAADPWGLVHDYQIRGKVMYTVPKLGWARQWVGGNAGWVVVGSAVMLIGFGIVTFAATFRRPVDDAPVPARRGIPGGSDEMD